MTNQRQALTEASSARSTGSKDTSRAVRITRAARAIFSAYPRDDYADPDAFVLQLGMVLERYPDEVISEISHPLTGVQRRCKKPPTIAHIVEAAEGVIDRQPAPVRKPEPPLLVDEAMQARVGELMKGLATKLKDDAQHAREEKIRAMADEEVTKRPRRTLATGITLELAKVVQGWKEAE